MPLEPGGSLGSDLLESRLGEGGMGEVWKAREHAAADPDDPFAGMLASWWSRAGSRS